jgi:hypothetical protein
MTFQNEVRLIMAVRPPKNKTIRKSFAMDQFGANCTMAIHFDVDYDGN